MAYVVALGTGSLIYGYLPDGGSAAPLVAVTCYTLAILPIGFTKLSNPPPPENVSVDIAKTWQISPVALAGIFASGGLSMLVQGFTPIYAASEGMIRENVALLMFLMQLGMLGVQYPLGALSDFIDRRKVLVISCLLITASAVAAIFTPLAWFVLAVVVFAIWSGSTETIYSISNAHANDRADPSDYVTLSSTMLIGWSASAFVFPAIVTAATPYAGPKAFMYFAIAVALGYAAFAAYRIVLTKRPPETGEAGGYRSAQLPNAEVLVAGNDGGDSRH
jgi:MFS family permease